MLHPFSAVPQGGLTSNLFCGGNFLRGLICQKSKARIWLFLERIFFSSFCWRGILVFEKISLEAFLRVLNSSRVQTLEMTDRLLLKWSQNNRENFNLPPVSTSSFFCKAFGDFGKVKLAWTMPSCPLCFFFFEIPFSPTSFPGPFAC